ncbi:hypothetical protein ID866_10954, partial [Astraeus odoratus]
WKASPEAAALDREIERIHTEGRSHPVVATQQHSEFATSWITQLTALIRRGFTSYWRNPTYIKSKLALNLGGGLVIGFIFFNTDDTIQGTQNKLFSIFMGTMMCTGLVQQLQSICIAMRDVYEVRERPSRMYSWTAFLVSQLIVEVPWNIICTSLYFFCFYWTVGLETSRAGITYLIFGVIFPIYYTTVGQAFAAMSPTPIIAALLFSTLFVFTIIFNGVLQPYAQLGWWKWMYWTSPLTYLIEALMGQVIGGTQINCSSTEIVVIEPPSGMTCTAYMSTYINEVGGYLTNPTSTSSCGYCPYRTADQFLFTNFNIQYSLNTPNLPPSMPITEFASLEFQVPHSLSDPGIFELFQRLSAWQAECSGFPLLFFTNPEVPSEIHLITGWDSVEAHEAWIAGERNQELLRVFAPFINILGMVHLDIDFDRIPKDALLAVCLEFKEKEKGQVEGEVNHCRGNQCWVEVGQNMLQGHHREVYVLTNEDSCVGNDGKDVQPDIRRRLHRVQNL